MDMYKSNKHQLSDIVQMVKNEEAKGNPLTADMIKPFLNKMITFRTIPKGDYISTVNSSIKNVCYILSGDFIVVRNSLEGKSNIVTRAKAPQFLFIDHIVLADASGIADVIALETCTALEINGAYFVQGLKEDGGFCFDILHNICEKFYQASHRSDHILFYDNPTKLMIYIVNYWLTRHNRPGKCVIDVKNAQIADEIGISTRTLYRAINKLKSDSLISISAGNIVVSEKQISAMQELLLFAAPLKNAVL